MIVSFVVIVTTITKYHYYVSLVWYISRCFFFIVYGKFLYFLPKNICIYFVVSAGKAFND